MESLPAIIPPEYNRGVAEPKKKSRAAFWTTVVIVAALLYIASIGAAFRVAQFFKGDDPDDDHWVWRSYRAVYAPISWAADANPEGIGRCLDWYLGIPKLPDAPPAEHRRRLGSKEVTSSPANESRRGARLNCAASHRITVQQAIALQSLPPPESRRHARF